LRIFVIGLDGFNLNLLKLRECKTLNELYKNSASGICKSYPPFTAPAWVSFQTGMNVGSHGIFGFLDKHIYSGNDIKALTFYEILHKNKYKVFLMNLPYTFPPKIEGDIITSWLDPGKSLKNHVFPTYLIKNFSKLEKYIVYPMGKSKKEKAKNILKSFRIKIDIIKEVISSKDYDFMFFLINETDNIQHLCYPEIVYNKNSFEGKVGRELLKELDKFIHHIIENINKDDILVILSDHGYRDYYWTFSINDWLYEQGYLTIDQNGEDIDIIKGKSVYKRRIYLPLVLNFIKENRWIVQKLRYFYDFIKSKLNIEITENYKINLKKSVAYSYISSHSSIKINDSVKDKERIIHEIIRKLNKLENIFVYRREDLFKGRNINKLDHIFLKSDKYLIVKGPRGKILRRDYTTDHDENGIIIFYNPKIFQNVQMKDVWIYDIAPTILHMFGLPVPKYMDGRVLTEIFKPDSEFARRKVKYSSYEKVVIRDKIRRLKAGKKL